MIYLEFISDDGQKIDINANSSSKVKEVLLEYLRKRNCQENLDPSIVSFVSKAIILNKGENLNKEIGKVFRNNIGRAFQIKVIDNGNIIGGGGGVFTVDVSKNKVKLIKFNNSAPEYRSVIEGLNIKSKCKNQLCLANNDIIYIKIGYVNNWSLLDNLKAKVICPECGKRVKPINYGFWDCKYEIIFEKEVEDGYEEGKINGKIGGDDFQIFDEKKNGFANFTKLVFNVTPNN